MRIDDVTDILREAAETVILPRFRSLGAGAVVQKSPGELVTVAGREAVGVITRRLRDVRDVPVVGEEAGPGRSAGVRDAPVCGVLGDRPRPGAALTGPRPAEVTVRAWHRPVRARTRGPRSAEIAGGAVRPPPRYL